MSSALRAVGEVTVDAAEEVSAKVVFLVLEINSFGNRAKLDNRDVAAKVGGESTRVTVEGDGMIHLSKQLLDSEELRAVRDLDAQTRNRIRGGQRTVDGQKYPTPSIALPSLVKAGVHAIPLGSVKEVNDILAAYREERARLIDAFLLSYPERVRDARVRLGDNFREDDYPPAEVIRRRFGVHYRFIQIGAPAALASISGEMYREERARAQAEGERLIASSRALLREELQGLLAYMIDRLKPAADGKRKVFHDAMVPKFVEAIAMIRSRDIADDQGIRSALARAEALVEGIDGDYLRDFVPVRKELADGFAAVKAQVDKLVAEAPDRYIDLE